MTRERMKLALAIVFLLGSVALLVFQIGGFRATRGDARADAGPDLAGMMDENARPEATRATVAWPGPAAGVAIALETNPFLRPAGATSKSPARRTGGSPWPRLSGIRLGDPPTAVINDRILEEGEAIAGWRVLAIERDRVILRSSDGKTIRLASSRLGAR